MLEQVPCNKQEVCCRLTDAWLFQYFVYFNITFIIPGFGIVILYFIFQILFIPEIPDNQKNNKGKGGNAKWDNY